MGTIRNGFIVLLLVLSGMTAPSWAQSYPVKPIRIVAGAPPGGGGDVILRPIAQRLSETLGQQVIVDNRPGAGSTIAAQLVAGSPPDGYTVFQASASGFSISPFLLKRRPYDPVQDFSPITLIATAPLMLTVHPSLPVKSVKELVAFAKARPSQLLYASNGKGSFSHFSTEMFLRAAGIAMVHVPYKGGTAAVMSALSGETQIVITAIPTLLSQVKAARLRALAVTSSKRSFVVPETPTVAEAGLPGFETVQWYGMFAPRHTPPAITDRLYAEIRKAAESPGIRGALAQEGAELALAGPQALIEFLRIDIAKWQKVIRESCIVLE
jgi:tripartite-type tricarboxylate transporter receptor subunit TctC